MTPVDPERVGSRRRSDFLGWAAVIVLLIPRFWVIAPAVFVVCGLRTWWLLRADRDVPNPTVAALILGFFVTGLWFWYFGSLLSGRVP